MLHLLVVVNHSTNEGTSSGVLNNLTIVLTTTELITTTETVTQTTTESFTVKADLNCTAIALAPPHRAVHMVLKDLYFK